jgi:hypothetical protein
VVVRVAIRRHVGFGGREQSTAGGGVIRGGVGGDDVGAGRGGGCWVADGVAGRWAGLVGDAGFGVFVFEAVDDAAEGVVEEE